MVNGIVLVDKPKGISSNTVANIVKKALKADKAGHLGTLDVLGHGLLPVTLGKSTKLFDYFLNKDKVYEASFRFGVETDTFDLEGEVVKTDNKAITEKDVLRIIPSFIGKFDQLPPAYSAKKINGRKAYDLARAGQEVVLKTKQIEIYGLNLLKQIADNEFLFRIHCSSGTYIRSLCRDMAASLSTCGVMSDIIRTRCGNLSLEDAVSLEDIKSGKYTLLQPESMFKLPEIFLSNEESLKVLNGVQIKLLHDDGDYKIFGTTGFIGIGNIKSNILSMKLRLI